MMSFSPNSEKQHPQANIEPEGALAKLRHLINPENKLLTVYYPGAGSDIVYPLLSTAGSKFICVDYWGSDNPQKMVRQLRSLGATEFSHPVESYDETLINFQYQGRTVEIKYRHRQVQNDFPQDNQIDVYFSKYLATQFTPRHLIQELQKIPLGGLIVDFDGRFQESTCKDLGQIVYREPIDLSALGLEIVATIEADSNSEFPTSSSVSVLKKVQCSAEGDVQRAVAHSRTLTLLFDLELSAERLKLYPPFGFPEPSILEMEWGQDYSFESNPMFIEGFRNHLLLQQSSVTSGEDLSIDTTIDRLAVEVFYAATPTKLEEYYNILDEVCDMMPFLEETQQMRAQERMDTVVGILRSVTS